MNNSQVQTHSTNALEKRGQTFHNTVQVFYVYELGKQKIRKGRSKDTARMRLNLRGFIALHAFAGCPFVHYINHQ